MAILWFFKVQFHSPFVLSLLFIAESSIDMMSFIFGPLIDRIHVPKMLKFVTILQGFLSLTAVFLFMAKIDSLFIIIALLVVYIISTIGSTLIYPAEEKILPLIVTKEHLTKVNGLFQMTYRTLDLLLDALATGLITLFSVKFRMIISIIVFANALLFYSKLYLPDKLQTTQSSEYFTNNYIKDLIKGWQTLQQEGRILFLIIPFAITNLFYGISSIGLPYFASRYLTSSAIGYGGLEFASSVGGLIGSILIQRFTFKKKRLEFIVSLSLLLAGGAIMLETTAFKSFPIVIILLTAFSTLWISIMNINFQVLVQESFSPHILGRIATINSNIVNCMIPIGSFLGGFVVHYLGSSWAVFMEGLAEALTAIVYLYIFKNHN